MKTDDIYYDCYYVMTKTAGKSAAVTNDICIRYGISNDNSNNTLEQQ